MFRTVLATVLVAFAINTVPVRAAEEAGAAPASAGPAAIAAGEVDWSLPPVELRQPSRGAVLGALYVSFAALQAYDGYTTTTGVARGAAEANGAMVGVVHNTAALWAVKGAVTGLSIFAAERLWRSHHRTQAIVMMIASNGIMSAVALHNASILRSQMGR